MVALKDFHGLTPAISADQYRNLKNNGFRKLKVRTDNSLTIKTEESGKSLEKTNLQCYLNETIRDKDKQM